MSRSLAAGRRDAPPRCSARPGDLPGPGAQEDPAARREVVAFGPASFVVVAAVYPELREVSSPVTRLDVTMRLNSLFHDHSPIGVSPSLSPLIMLFPFK